jgi:hypothetical protein
MRKCEMENLFVAQQWGLSEDLGVGGLGERISAKPVLPDWQ